MLFMVYSFMCLYHYCGLAAAVGRVGTQIHGRQGTCRAHVRPWVWSPGQERSRHLVKMLCASHCAEHQTGGLSLESQSILIWWALSLERNLQKTNDGRDEGEQEPLFTVGEIANWCSQYGNQCGEISKGY